MTIPPERTRALRWAGELLRDLRLRDDVPPRLEATGLCGAQTLSFVGGDFLGWLRRRRNSARMSIYHPPGPEFIGL
jgi:hypothetical protein